MFASAHWLTGTVDWLHWGGEETVPWVDDLKTGHWPINPKTAGQLRSYLLLPWVLQGCPVDWEGVVSVTKWERYPLDGRPSRSSHRLCGLDMAEHLEVLRYTAKHPGEVNPGEQCLFCDCRLEHPASGWMQNYKHRRLFSCWKGIKRALTEGREDLED